MNKTVQKKIDRLNKENFQMIAESEKYFKAYNLYCALWTKIQENQTQILFLKQKAGIEDSLPDDILDCYKSDSKLLSVI